MSGIKFPRKLNQLIHPILATQGNVAPITNTNDASRAIIITS